MTEITQEILHELFYYEDGKLFHKKRKRGAKIGGRAGTKTGVRPYRRIWVLTRLYSEHRLVFFMFNGYFPKTIDHISDDLTDEGIKSNKIENLRAATSGQNNQKCVVRKNSSSVFKGVSWARHAKKWIAMIRTKKGHKNLGSFTHETDAAKAYDAAVKKEYPGDEHVFLNIREGDDWLKSQTVF